MTETLLNHYDAVSEFYKLKNKLALTSQEIKNAKRAKKYRGVASWAVKYQNFKFPQIEQYAPKGYSKSTLKILFCEVKRYIEHNQPLRRAEKFKPDIDFCIKNIEPLQIQPTDITKITELENMVNDLKTENEMLKERIKELEKMPSVDLKALKKRLQNEIDSLYFKLEAISILESELNEESSINP